MEYSSTVFSAKPLRVLYKLNSLSYYHNHCYYYYYYHYTRLSILIPKCKPKRWLICFVQMHLTKLSEARPLSLRVAALVSGWSMCVCLWGWCEDGAGGARGTHPSGWNHCSPLLSVASAGHGFWFDGPGTLSFPSLFYGAFTGVAREVCNEEGPRARWFLTRAVDGSGMKVSSDSLMGHIASKLSGSKMKKRKKKNIWWQHQEKNVRIIQTVKQKVGWCCVRLEFSSYDWESLFSSAITLVIIFSILV